MVIAATAVQRVVARLAIYRVPATASIETVIAALAENGIGTTATIQVLVCSIPDYAARCRIVVMIVAGVVIGDGIRVAVDGDVDVVLRAIIRGDSDGVSELVAIIQRVNIRVGIVEVVDPSAVTAD